MALSSPPSKLVTPEVLLSEVVRVMNVFREDRGEKLVRRDTTELNGYLPGADGRVAYLFAEFASEVARGGFNKRILGRLVLDSDTWNLQRNGDVEDGGGLEVLFHTCLTNADTVHAKIRVDGSWWANPGVDFPAKVTELHSMLSSVSDDFESRFMRLFAQRPETFTSDDLPAFRADHQRVLAERRFPDLIPRLEKWVFARKELIVALGQFPGQQLYGSLGKSS